MGEIKSGCVWLDPQDQVASFHPVEGWEKKEYTDLEGFRSLTEGLLRDGYKFQ